MLKALMIVVALVMPMSLLTGCGKTEEQQTQEKVDQGNVKLSRMNAINTELLGKGIVVQSNSGYEAKAVDLSGQTLKKMSKEDRQKTIVLLKEYVTHSGDVQNLFSSNKVIYSGDRTELARWLDNAKAILATALNLDKQEKDEKTNKLVKK